MNNKTILGTILIISITIVACTYIHTCCTIKDTSTNATPLYGYVVGDCLQTSTHYTNVVNSVPIEGEIIAIDNDLILINTTDGPQAINEYWTVPTYRINYQTK